MPDESVTPETPVTDPMKPTVQIKALSMVEFGPFKILTFDRELTRPVLEGTAEVTHEIMVSIRREPRNKFDDPGAIPLTDLPALQMILKEIGAAAMVVTPFHQQAPAQERPMHPPVPKKRVMPTKKR